MNAITISNLQKHYSDTEAVRDITFSVEKGDFFGFIGPNGAGKTTTIHSIMGLLNFEGSISIFGHDVVFDYKEARRHVGLSPQEYNFDPFLSVENTLLYTAGYFGIPPSQARKRVEKLLKDFNLLEKRKQDTKALSGGMKRRLIIARALVHDPPILILDEPTAGIDVKLRRELWDILRQLNRQGKTIILTTHYIEEVEQLCNTVAIINKGKIIALDKKSTIMEDLSNQTLKIRLNKKVPLRLFAKCGKARFERNTLLVTGRGIRSHVSSVIDVIKNFGADVLEVDIIQESLESVFLRVTKESKDGSAQDGKKKAGKLKNVSGTRGPGKSKGDSVGKKNKRRVRT